MRQIANPTLPTLLLLLVAMLSSGCTYVFTENNPEKPWSDARYRELSRQDEQRALGVDARKTGVSDVVLYVPRRMWDAVEWTWNVSTGHTASRYARELAHRNPDIRRRAVYVFSDQEYGRKPPYTSHYANMAKADRDASVRAAGIRALNRARDASQTGVYIAALEDENQWVRLEAAKALANIPDEKAIPSLIKLLADDQQPRDIRIAAADGLRAYHRSEVAQALIRTLDGRDFGVAWQSRRSLNLMTAHDFRYRPADWLAYLTSTEQPFVK